MNKIILSAFATAAILLTACGGEPPAYNEPVSNAPVNVPANTPVFSSGDSNQIISVNPNGAPVTLNQAPGQQANVAQPVNKNAKGLNPEHGQPGHRCDIPVGTPLNTPAGATPQPQQQVQQLQSMPSPAQGQPMQVGPQITPIQPAPSSAGKGRINPAHGEPGHDCAVAVGAPLN